MGSNPTIPTLKQWYAMRTPAQRCIEEYEKYKHIVISEGLYTNASGVQYRISDVDNERGTAVTTSLLNNYELRRTLHWCRKNLKRVG